MLLFKQSFFLWCFIISCTAVFSQEKNAAESSIFEEFKVFFDKEIKHQGVKGNWIFGLNEITAYHKFDYDNDGVNDLLIEFNATPVDEGNYTNYYAVLFKNENNKRYQFIDFIETVDLQFLTYDAPKIIFQNSNNHKNFTFKLVNSKFKLNNK